MGLEPVGCLLIGGERHDRLGVLREKLHLCGVQTVRTGRADNLLHAVQEGLYAARRPGGACIAAEGEMWAAALALAAQMHVDRVALIAPTDFIRSPRDAWEKQIGWMKSFAQRNLFFCVSEVLLLEETCDERSRKRVETICRRLCNATVRRASLADERWTKCKQSPMEAAARFLAAGEFVFPLAK